MARYGSRYARRYRRYKRFYRSFGGRRYRTRRFINGSTRSSVRVKVPLHFNLSFTQAANTQGSNIARVCPLDSSSSYASAMTNGLYRTYCHLYDEVKVIGMKAQINVSSQVGGSDIPSLQIYSAFDRRHAFGEANPTFDALKTFSTFSVATAVNNSVAKLQRSLYAGDLLEKAQWHDCTFSDPNLPAGDPDKSADAYYHDKAYEAAGANPNFFSPALFLAMAIPNITAQQSVNANLDVTYYFSFRNPKYGAGASAQRLSVENLAYPVSRHVADDDDGDMDDAPALPDLPVDADEGLMDEDAAAAPAALTRRARSNASADLQAAAAPSTRRVRISKNVK